MILHQPFTVICMNCYEKAQQTGTYEGKVNEDFMPISPTHAVVRYRCFTCGQQWNRDIDPEKREEDRLPMNKEEFEKKQVIRAKKKLIN